MTLIQLQRRTFRGRDRLKKRFEFLHTQQKGFPRIGKRFVLNVSENTKGIQRLGVVVTKSTGNAVVRSSWKRLIREAFRLNRQKLPKNTDNVVRVRRNITSYPDKNARKELEFLFEQANKK